MIAARDHAQDVKMICCERSKAFRIVTHGVLLQKLIAAELVILPIKWSSRTCQEDKLFSGIIRHLN